MTTPDRVALVVGGTGGLGRACCIALAEGGHDVLVGYRSRSEEADSVASAVRARGRWAEPRQLTVPEGPFDDLDAVHTLVFAAGHAIRQPYVSQLDPAELEGAMRTELHGFVAVLGATLPHLRRHGGSVVALTSAGLARHPPGDVLSTAPKAAITAVLRAVAREEGRHGVRANAVAIGVIDAGMFHSIGFDETWREAALAATPLRRFGAPEDVGRAVAFLASDHAAFVTGQTLFVDGGYHV